jgi:hypothetical protein
VPYVVHGFILTCVPVVIATAIGDLAFVWLRRKKTRFNVLSWHFVGTFLGTVAGELVGLAMQLQLIGALTGAVCGLTQAFVWWKGMRPAVGEGVVQDRVAY